MEKQKAIAIFRQGHEEFGLILQQLAPRQIESIPVYGTWTIREVMVHIAAWYWEFVKEIDGILADKPVVNSSDEDTFNKQAIEARKRKNVGELILEWQDSFQALITKIGQLSEKEWNHVSKGIDGKQIAMQSLFKYLETGISHEAAHAREVKNKLKLK